MAFHPATRSFFGCSQLSPPRSHHPVVTSPRGCPVCAPHFLRTGTISPQFLLHHRGHLRALLDDVATMPYSSHPLVNAATVAAKGGLLYAIPSMQNQYRRGTCSARTRLASSSSCCDTGLCDETGYYNGADSDNDADSVYFDDDACTLIERLVPDVGPRTPSTTMPVHPFSTDGSMDEPSVLVNRKDPDALKSELALAMETPLVQRGDSNREYDPSGKNDVVEHGSDSGYSSAMSCNQRMKPHEEAQMPESHTPTPPCRKMLKKKKSYPGEKAEIMGLSFRKMKAPAMADFLEDQWGIVSNVFDVAVTA